MAAELVVDGLSVARAGRRVLSDVSFALRAGDVVPVDNHPLSPVQDINQAMGRYLNNGQMTHQAPTPWFSKRSRVFQRRR